MSGDEAALWTAISTFEIDGLDTSLSLTFAARLARENGWNPAYTQRVLGEYRKFLFLCCVSDTGVTPSDPVDQAWHLHLTYTRSYWIDLCRNTLGRDLHHNPTKGGAAEGQKFDGMYTASQTLYERYFGETPPADIWHPNAERFADIDFQRVNCRTNWIIPKPGWIQPARTSSETRDRPVKLISLLLGLVALCFVQANGDSVFLILLLGGGLFTWLIITIANADWSSTSQRDRRDDGGGTPLFMGDTNNSHDGHGHGGDGHSNDAGDGGSGCSASGCSSGCSGCGGGCGS